MRKKKREESGVSLRNPGTRTKERSLGVLIFLSIIISILMVAASVYGILARDRMYTSDEITEAFVPNDLVNICVGLPILLASMILARRGMFAGRLLWLGALIYVAYNYTIYALAIEPGWIYLAYPALVLLSMVSVVLLFLKIKGPAARARLEGRVPERISAGILILFGVMFSALAVHNIVMAELDDAPLGRLDLALNATDAAFSPLWVICGISLWRHRNFGYVTGLGMLFQASMLFIGLIMFLLVQPLMTEASFLWLDTVIVFIMGFVCFIPLALFLRGALGLPRTFLNNQNRITIKEV